MEELVLREVKENDEINIVDILKISNRVDNVDERIAHVNEIIEENIDIIQEYNASSVKGKVAEKMMVNKLVEEMGTYIINSKNILSCRKIKESFYETEKRYGQYAIAKSTFPIDFNDSKGTLSNIEVLDEYNLESDYCYDYVIKTTEMDKSELSRLIGVAMRDKDEMETKLSGLMMDIYNFTIRYLSDIDIEIFNLMINGLNDREISEKVNMPRRTVNYRTNKIIEIVGGFSSSED